MKLAIIVPYMASAEQEPLIRIHLEHIQRFTTVPFTIYAAIIRRRFPLDFYVILENSPNLIICDIPELVIAPGQKNESEQEHTYYLDRLLTIAIKDDASHIVILHPDSFPINQNWVQTLSKKIDDQCVIASTDGFYSACFMFKREFYLDFQPKFNPPPDDERGVQYIELLTKHPFMIHVGFGYFYKAFQNGLNWYFMKDTVLPEDRKFGFEIHDNIIFHWGGASRMIFLKAPKTNNNTTFFQKALYALRGLIPVKARYHFVRFLYPLLGDRLRKKIMNDLNTKRSQNLAQFLKNPITFIGKYY